MVSRKKLLVTIIVICGLVLGYPIFLRDKLGTALAQDIPTPTPELGPTASPAESIVPTEAPAVTQMPQESQQMPALPVVLPPFWLEFEQLVQSYDPGFTTPKDSALVPWAVFGGTIVLLLLLLAGLIGLIWFLSKLRKKPELRVPEPVQNFTRPTQPAPRKIDFVPAWIKKLGKTDILTVSTSEKEDGLQETILIGIGPAGRVVLSEVAQNLHERFGSKLPDKINLVQIDVQPKGKNPPPNTKQASVNTPPRGLTSDQCILLRPDFKEVEENLQKEPDLWPHWKWYTGVATTSPSTSSIYDRARGRMALFYDLSVGEANSALINTLKRVFQKYSNNPGKNPAVRIIGTTFDDASSGMLVDIIRLTQAFLGQTVKAQLWLMGPTQNSWSERLLEPGKLLPPDEQMKRTLATLRELERFQMNGKVRFDYVGATNRQDLLHKEAESALVSRVFLFQSFNQIQSNDSMNKADLPPEFDELACMADCLIALLQKQADMLLAGRLTNNQNDQGLATISSIGSYSEVIPSSGVGDVMAWRLLRDVLFEKELGLTPKEDWIPSTDTYNKYSDPELPNWQTDLDMLLDSLKHSGLDAFGEKVAIELDQILNGDGSDLYKRRGGLATASVWLEKLMNELSRQGRIEARAVIEDLMNQISKWKRTFEERLYASCVTNIDASTKNLASNFPSRKTNISHKLLQTIYIGRFRPKERPRSDSSEPLPRLARHFGWKVDYDYLTNQLRVRFIIPSPDFIWDESTYDLTQYTYNYDSDQLLNALFLLAKPLTRDSSVTDLLRRDSEFGGFADQSEWIEKSRPRIAMNKSKAGLLIGQLEKLNILVTPGNSNGRLNLEPKLEDVQGSDPNRVTLLQVVNQLPLKSTKLEENRQSTIVPPSMYVWAAEQQAAEIENPEKPLSVRFVSWLGSSNSELLEYFGLGLLYMLRGDKLGYNLVSEDLRRSPFKVLDGLMKIKNEDSAAFLASLKDEVEKKRQQTQDRRAVVMKQAETAVLPTLEKSPNSGDKELAVYLSGLMDKEKQIY